MEIIRKIEIELHENRKEMKVAVDARSKMIAQTMQNVVKTATIMASRDAKIIKLEEEIVKLEILYQKTLKDYNGVKE